MELRNSGVIRAKNAEQCVCTYTKENPLLAFIV